MEQVNGYYFNENIFVRNPESMKVISKIKNAIFIGQSVKYPGALFLKV